MLDALPGIAVVVGLGLAGLVGLGFVQIVGSRSGERSSTAFAGLFPAQGRRDWPTGLQESDAPRFDVTHLDALRPGTMGDSGPGSPGSDPVPSNHRSEVIELDGLVEPGAIALERIGASVVREHRPRLVSSMPRAPGRDLQASQYTRS